MSSTQNIPRAALLVVFFFSITGALYHSRTSLHLRGQSLEVSSCSSDPDCIDDGIGFYCNYGSCTNTCGDDSTCINHDLPGYHCASSVCVPDCKQDSDCGNGEHCDNGLCENSCNDSTDCTSGYYCSAGSCTRGCSTNQDCSSAGFYCSAGSCTNACAWTNDCSNAGLSGYYCYNGNCINACSTSLDCTSGGLDHYHCDGGRCAEGDCSSAGDCSSGFYCSAGLCNNTCGDVHTCATNGLTGYYCSAGFCTPGCDSTIDCTSGSYCSSGSCYNHCNSNDDCAQVGPGYRCNSTNTCQHADCSEPEDCSSYGFVGYYCSHSSNSTGLCANTCSTTDDCHSGGLDDYYCNNGTCASGCGADPDCPSGYYCSAGNCENFCGSDSDCAGLHGYYCNAGHSCDNTCNNNIDCSGLKGYYCSSSSTGAICGNGCSTSDDCTSNGLSGYACSAGSCVSESSSSSSSSSTSPSSSSSSSRSSSTSTSFSSSLPETFFSSFAQMDSGGGRGNMTPTLLTSNLNRAADHKPSSPAEQSLVSAPTSRDFQSAVETVVRSGLNPNAPVTLSDVLAGIHGSIQHGTSTESRHALTRAEAVVAIVEQFTIPLLPTHRTTDPTLQAAITAHHLGIIRGIGNTGVLSLNAPATRAQLEVMIMRARTIKKSR